MITTRHGVTIQALLQRAEQVFPEREIASRTRAGMFRYTHREFAQRVAKLASALVASGVRKGDRVATLAWNQHSHLEACIAVPAIGAVLHTLNLRLPPDHLAYTINRAADRVILVDADLVPSLESLSAGLKTVEQYIIMGDGPEVKTRLTPVISYEALIEPAEPMRHWPEANEWDEAGICFASTVSGLPAEVTYTHRALRLHSRAFCLADSVGVSAQDTMLMMVPLCHANAWGLPFAAIWMGTTLVLPGPHPDVNAFCALMEQERVTLAAGVPAVWIDVLALLEREPYTARNTRRVLCRTLPFDEIHRTTRATSEESIRRDGHVQQLLVRDNRRREDLAGTWMGRAQSDDISGRARKRDTRRAAGSPVAGLLRWLASAFGRGRPAHETMVPVEHTRWPGATGGSDTGVPNQL